MYCPQCSQQQFSNDVRFCPRCGFQLLIVSELLASNGTLVPGAASEPNQGIFKGRAPIGAKIMFFGLALLPFSIVFSIVFDSPGPFAIPFLLFMIGITQVLYVRLFGSRPAREMPRPQPAMWSGPPPLNLPYADPPPIDATRRIDTSEIRQPPSVAEHTTKLLDT